MKATEIRDLSVDEINARIENLQREIFQLRFRRATIEDENPILLRTIRRDIARYKTVLREKELTSEGAR
jgi:large subunit ribosomal protein L29